MLRNISCVFGPYADSQIAKQHRMPFVGLIAFVPLRSAFFMCCQVDRAHDFSIYGNGTEGHSCISGELVFGKGSRSDLLAKCFRLRGERGTDGIQTGILQRSPPRTSLGHDFFLTGMESARKQGEDACFTCRKLPCGPKLPNRGPEKSGGCSLHASLTLPDCCAPGTLLRSVSKLYLPYNDPRLSQEGILLVDCVLCITQAIHLGSNPRFNKGLAGS